MTAPWLSLIGLGEDGVLGEAELFALKNAEVIYGGERHFDLLKLKNERCRQWPSPFASVFEELKTLEGRKVAVLATGDPQWYGIGSSLARHFDAKSISVYPTLSAYQLAAAKLGWALQDTECLSVHGRSVNLLRAWLYPGARILALTSNSQTPADVANLLVSEGYGRTQMTVLEHLGGDKERLLEGAADTWSADVADFHILALEVIAAPGVSLKSRVPGLPDDAFRHDGKMTKQDIRAVTLAELRPYPGAVLWDIGAGCGSVAIEWLRAADRTRAIGLEPHPDRRAMAADNANALGVPHLNLIDATAPEGLTDLEQPDAIFIGGGLTADGVLEACRKALKSNGRLVANAVTLESEVMLLKAHETYGGSLKRVAIQKASAVGSLTGWRPAMPVTQWSYTKP